MDGAKQYVTIDPAKGEGARVDFGAASLLVSVRHHRAKLVVTFERVGEQMVVSKTIDPSPAEGLD